MKIQPFLCRLSDALNPKSILAAIAMLFACASMHPQATAADNATAKFADQVNCPVKPVWPQQALADKKSGTVTFSLLIGTDGKVKRSRLVKSSGHPELDEAARIGIEQCIIPPGMIDGKPQEAWMQFQYVWTPE